MSDRRVAPVPPFGVHIGIESVEIGGGRAVMTVAEGPAVENRTGVIHGGAIASLLDITMSQAVRSGVEEGTRLATSTLTISYVAPGRGVLTCEARLVKAGGAIAYVEGKVLDEAGEVVATAQGSWRIRRVKPPA